MTKRLTWKRSAGWPGLSPWVVLLALLGWAGQGLRAADAPGAPGVGSVWTTGNKQGIGTSTTVDSRVWYTIAQGVVTEVYFPQIDVPNVQDLQLIITDGSTFVELERDATNHSLQLVDPQALTYPRSTTPSLASTASSGPWSPTRIGRLS